jgi:hypothetical protein
MAVTQISRIQIRRGRKLSPTGIPQLAGGEFAWAVDSQELFIGNGSVAEGAPYVGNTKILTEHDNILALVSSYKFAGSEADSPVPFSVARSFQNKLDEYVSVFDFGALGDGVSNNVSAFETAFTQLYQNTIETFKKVLVVPNGEYIFDTDLRVPSYVQLVGETKHGVVLKFSNGYGLKFVNEIKEIPDVLGPSTRPENIKIGNLTVESAMSDISGSRFVLFENVAFKGNYTLSNPTMFPQEQSAGLEWKNNLVGVETTDIKFKTCTFKNLPIAVKVQQTILSETKILFDDCDFDLLDTGVLVTGVLNQKNSWKFVEVRFSNTANHSVYISNGTGTILRECSFEKCGVRLDGTPVVPSVYFGQSQNNLLIECTSDRQQSKGVTTSELLSYVPEVFGADKVTFLTRNQSFIEPFESYTPIAIFSAYNKFLEIDYFLRLETGDIRTGKMRATIIKEDGLVDLTDDYTYTSPPGVAVGFQTNATLTLLSVPFGKLYLGAVISGSNISLGTRITSATGSVDPTTGIGDYGVDKFPVVSPTSSGPNYQTINFVRDTMTNIQFRARLVDNDDSTGAETVLLEYRQISTTRGSAGTISFDVSYGTSGV